MTANLNEIEIESVPDESKNCNQKCYANKRRCVPPWNDLKKKPLAELIDICGWMKWSRICRRDFQMYFFLIKTILFWSIFHGFVPSCQFDNTSALIWAMVCRRTGAKPIPDRRWRLFCDTISPHYVLITEHHVYDFSQIFVGLEKDDAAIWMMIDVWYLDNLRLSCKIRTIKWKVYYICICHIKCQTDKFILFAEKLFVTATPIIKFITCGLLSNVLEW